jgi:hypothetical protein
MAVFEREEIQELLESLADRLAADGIRANLLLVGGAAISMEYGDRPATRDVDAGISPAEPVLAVARQMAQERGLSEDWLNDKVKMFMPHDGISEAGWKAIVTREHVIVRVAPAHVLLAMKLRAGRGKRDATDIELLLDVCGVSTCQEAEDIFDRCYPNEEIAPRARALLEDRYE